MDEQFSISVHHGGHFTENGRKYVGGAVDIVDNCDPDRWTKVEIESICRDFGYTSVSRLWYKMPGVDQELADFHLIVDDSDAMYLTELVRGHQDIHVYVEHPIHDLILVDEGQDAGGEGVQPFALEQDYTGYYDNDDGSEHDDHDEDDFYSFYDSDGMRGGKELIIEHPPEIFHISDSSDSVGSDGGGSGLEDDVELNHGVRDFVEDSSDSWDGKDDADVNEPGQMGAGLMNSDYESEELHSLVESSSDDELRYDSDDKSEGDNSTHMGDEREQKEEQERKFPVFKPVAKAEHIYFEKDMMFTTPKQFKEAITDYAVHGGWGIRFIKNDLQRVRVVCQEGCKFVAYLTKLPREKSYQLRTLTLEHTCSRSYKNPRCSSSYIGKKLMKKVKRQPNIKLKDIQDAIHDKYTLNISAAKASRARDKPREYVDGVYTQQYNQLWEYCKELRRASPGSTILMKAIHWFGCRPFIGLDACHLKNKSGGQLITAVCRDPNEEYFPLAYVVVEAETKDSWTWFINLLLADISQNKRWVFMSDQQKGLVQTFIDNWPQYEHRICCKHLYNNFRKNHPSVLIREMFWRAAKATYKEEFDRVMDELKGIDADAHSWLDAHSTKKWAKHMFSEDALTDIIVNNMCESFNSRILKFRSKLIISMLECIKLYLMTRFQDNREKILRVESNICAKVLKRLHKEKVATSRWLACWAGQTQFEVKNGLQSFTVDLATTHCSCRKWDISGIPCAHAITCIFFNRQDVEQYVHPCYHVSTYKACYEPIIAPINGQNM
ncbi:hypothetical protein SO802_031832 [Lithocarpus litseifolius]|uniref:SWIM-type domain-containing protein n=1 Tax=Lithocarpus litseifolius TaxID=425828 RepID=A0AAW2BLC9_9ROSI